MLFRSLLETALVRTIEGAARHVELVTGARTPEKRVGAPCRWCPLRETCTEGQAFLRGDDPDDGIVD